MNDASAVAAGAASVSSELPRVRHLLRAAAVHATLAPSIHRTEPWRLVLEAGSLEVHADWSRQLRALDPSGRQLVISCGSALGNARATVAAADRRALVARRPDPREPDLLARLTLGGPGSGPMPGPVDSPDDEVRQYAVTDPDQLLLVARLDRMALLEQETDPARHTELRAWRTVPRAADEALRDPRMVVLGTTHDGPLEWLRTGEAVQHLVLGCRPAFSVHSLPHVIENPRIREQLRVGLELDVLPQAVLLLGPPTARAPSRNRRLVDVLSVAPRG